MRWVLVQAAVSILRCRHPQTEALRGLGDAHRRARRGKKIAVVALARRLAGLLYAMLRDGTTYDPRAAEARNLACGPQNLVPSPLPPPHPSTAPALIEHDLVSVEAWVAHIERILRPGTAHIERILRPDTPGSSGPVGSRNRRLKRLRLETMEPSLPAARTAFDQALKPLVSQAGDDGGLSVFCP